MRERFRKKHIGEWQACENCRYYGLVLILTGDLPACIGSDGIARYFRGESFRPCTMWKPKDRDD